MLTIKSITSIKKYAKYNKYFEASIGLQDCGKTTIALQKVAKLKVILSVRQWLKDFKASILLLLAKIKSNIMANYWEIIETLLTE